MNQTPKPDQFKRLIELISPYMSPSENRNIYIDHWCLSHPNLYGLIKWGGSDRAFATHVVGLFLKHGFLEHKSAFQYFLEAVRDDMGEPNRNEIQDILDGLPTYNSDKVTKHLKPEHYTSIDIKIDNDKTFMPYKLRDVVMEIDPTLLGNFYSMSWIDAMHHVSQKLVTLTNSTEEEYQK